MSFEEQFPSLKGLVRTIEETNRLEEQYKMSFGKPSGRKLATTTAISNSLLDKQRAREIITNLRDRKTGRTLTSAQADVLIEELGL